MDYGCCSAKANMYTMNMVLYCKHQCNCSVNPVIVVVFPFKTSGKYGEKEGNCHKGLFEGNNTYTCKGVIHNGEILKNIEYKVIC